MLIIDHASILANSRPQTTAWIAYPNRYDIDDDAVDQKPTRKEALTAAFALRSYVADINEPFARKLEGILASFG